MKLSYTFGAAVLEVHSTRATSETPENPVIGPCLARFFGVMEKAFLGGKEQQFLRCLGAFASEVDTYLDDQRIQQVLPQGEDMTWDELRELEDFMNRSPKRKKE